MRLGIGIPLNWPYMHTDFFDSFLLMDKCKGHMLRANSGSIDVMRNSIVASAQELNCTHLMFLDTDMIFPPDTISRLAAHDLDIVGGLCFKRWPPFHPTLYTGERYKLEFIYPYDDGLVEVTATGAACLLIKMEVFNKIKYPWFKFDKTPDNRMVGEDINFCYKAADVDYKLYVDTSIRTLHIVQMAVDDNFYRLELALNKQGKSIHFTGREVINPWEQ